MLTVKQISEIKNHLEKAQNPLFFFDNDADGLCSFLLLRRKFGKGKGVPVRSFPSLDESYFRKIEELNADYVFVLDKPIISEKFFEKIKQHNLPLVWIDHHEIPDLKIPEFVYYYNPVLNKDKGIEPTTYLCYQVSREKSDLWIAIAGCVSDKFLPDFYFSFFEEFPELGVQAKNAFDIFYKSDIGKIARIMSFALKDRTTNVINMVRFLVDVKSPHEVLQECRKNYSMHKRFNEINQKYVKLIEKARAVADEGKILFFQYGGGLSISSDISNELSYIYPEKVIVVVYVAGAKANISVRGKNIREIVLKVLEGLEDATGGGHEDAVGAKIKIEDLETFRDRLEEIVG